MEIKFLKGDEIDKVKWNSCVHYAVNGNVFGYKWYLDNVAKDWDALIEGDYESVFPLPYQQSRFKKVSIQQPRLMRELGLFSTHVLSKARIKAFLEAIPSHYKKIDLVLNEQMPPIPESGFQFEEQTNYQLLLQDGYENASDGYSDQLNTQLEISKNAGLIPLSNVKPERFADFFRKEKTYYPGKDQDSHALLRIIYNCLHRGWGFASGVTDEAGELLAANFMIYSHNKMISLCPVVSKKGKETGALEFLFDLLIQSHADRPLILDFNHDENMGVGQAFGATANRYLRMTRKSKGFFGL